MKFLSGIKFVVLILIITLAGCQEKIDLEVPGSSHVLVVEAEISTETDSSFVKLTKSVDYFSKDSIPFVSSATVNVNGIPFTHSGLGIYKPAAGFVGLVNTDYHLNIVNDGKTYTASSHLDPMFEVDSFGQEFKPQQGFIRPGYAIKYFGKENREGIKYTYFRFGIISDIIHADSLFAPLVLFDNSVSKNGVEFSFELPFLRLQPGQTAICVFRSCDKTQFNFLQAFSTQSSGAPGPFQSPPANLPTNITNGGIGYFAAYDVKRFRYQVK